MALEFFFWKSVFSLSAKQCFWLILSFQITNEWVDYFQFLNIPMEIVRRIQKAPPLIPWTYIFSVLYCNFQTYNYNIGLIFQKLRIVTLGAFQSLKWTEMEEGSKSNTHTVFFLFFVALINELVLFLFIVLDEIKKTIFVFDLRYALMPTHYNDLF